MNMQKFAALSATATLLMPPAAHAQQAPYDARFLAKNPVNTVKNLAAECRTYMKMDEKKRSEYPAEYVFHAGVCAGTVGAFINMTPPTGICAPDNALGLGKTADLFIAWVERNPKKREYNYSHGLRETLLEAFPCEKKNP